MNTRNKTKKNVNISLKRKTENLIKKTNKNFHIKEFKGKRFKVELSKNLLYKLTHTNNIPANLYARKLTEHKPSKIDPEINVPWDFDILKQQILDTQSPNIYSWYHEDTSSSGNSTAAAVEAYKNIKYISYYLKKNKDVSLTKDICLYSKELGNTILKTYNPFFTVPYGGPSVYGGKSNEINLIMGTVTTGGVMTIPLYTQYSTEVLANIIKENSSNKDQFFMHQLFITSDSDVNTSLIDRMKDCGSAVVILTIDAGTNNHGGLLLLENQADDTWQWNFCGNILADPVFNIKCYQKYGCIGTRDTTVINQVAEYLKMKPADLTSKYDFQISFDYVRTIAVEGFPLLNISNKNSDQYDFSIEHYAKLCHANKPMCKYIKRNITKGVPLVIKGCLTSKLALDVQKSGADGIYVSNHGGRFLYNSIAPLDVVTEIRDATKKVNKNFGVWLDGGIRNGQDILSAYAKGAEFVGVGRPFIYANVLYGLEGVSAINKKMQFELTSQCVLTGQNDLSDYDSLKKIITNE